MKLHPAKNIRGQALLLVLLSMSVVLTVALSIISKSITDISITSKDEDSLRAFSAAEAGIERALATNLTGTVDLSNNSKTNITITNLQTGTNRQYLSPFGLLSGETFIYWFVNHNSSGEIDCGGSLSECYKGRYVNVCWGDDTGSEIPAIEATIVYLDPVWNVAQNFSGAKTARLAIDPDSNRRTGNSFSIPDPGTWTCTIQGKPLKYKKSIDFSGLGIPNSVWQSNQGGLQLVSIKMLYNSSTSYPAGIELYCPGSCTADDKLPIQGVKIVSMGSSSEANRKLEAVKTFGEPPSIFDAAIFSPSSAGLTK